MVLRADYLLPCYRKLGSMDRRGEFIVRTRLTRWRLLSGLVPALVDSTRYLGATALQMMPALLFVFLLPLPARAAQATEPSHGVVVVYDDVRWLMTRKNPHLIVLNCRDAACGGVSSGCVTLQFDNPANSYAPGVLAQVKDINRRFIGVWERKGQRLVLVDAPETQTLGRRIIALSSLRYRSGNRIKRIWSAQIQAPFGTTGLVCESDEDKYPVASAAWMSLLQAILIPSEQ